ncbi:MAG: DUF3768 domain-containing protein [Rhodospirillales bacterium]|nr:DUF3768 domain-containing protein [Rhodospirillales bacterium]
MSNADNDPHGEHDFGSSTLAKATPTTPTMRYGSEDPTDPAKTTRVLIIMLAGIIEPS